MKVTLAPGLEWPTKYLTIAERTCLLIGYKGRGLYSIKRFIRVPNKAKDPKHHFTISLTQAEVDALELHPSERIIGAIHSHGLRGKDKPSAHDINGIPAGLLGAIFCKGNVITFYDCEGELASFWLLGQSHSYVLRSPASS
jgi:proteasome lid subunit RPN8/RPN11